MAKLPFNQSVVNDEYIELLYDYLSLPPAWMKQAACLGISDSDDYKAVLSACQDCPVAKQCYQYGLDHNISSGVFGGVVFPVDTSK